MNDFLRTIFKSYGPLAAQSAKRIFSDLSLPVPYGGEFYNAAKNNFIKQIVFLAEYGIAFRFYEPYAIPKNDLILQPLYKAELGNMHFDIVPIVEMGVEKVVSDFLYEELEKQGIDWGDVSPHNAGYLPGIEGIKFNRPVVVDVCDTITLSRIFNAAADENSTPLQDKIYAPLLGAAKKIEEHGLLSQGGDFLRVCREFSIRNNINIALIERNFDLIHDDGQTASALFAVRFYAASLQKASLG